MHIYSSKQGNSKKPTDLCGSRLLPGLWEDERRAEVLNEDDYMLEAEARFKAAEQNML